MAGIIRGADSYVHRMVPISADKIEPRQFRFAAHQTQRGSARDPGRRSNPANNTIHRQLIVAIQTKISNGDRAAFDMPSRDGEADKIIAVRAVARSVLRHREVLNLGAF